MLVNQPNKGKVKKIDKKMTIDCPELNFLTDAILSGTMIQVGSSI